MGWLIGLVLILLAATLVFGPFIAHGLALDASAAFMAFASVPGLLLYGLLFFIVLSITDIWAPENRKLRSFVASAACIGFALGIPCLLDMGVERRVDAIKATDKPFPQRERGDTVALIRFAATGGKQNECSDLCLRLLYNGGWKQVIVVEALDKPDGKLPDGDLRAYRIQRQEGCHQQRDFGGDYNHYKAINLPWPMSRRIEERASAGECIVATTASLAQASTAFVLHIRPGGYQPYERITVMARYQLLDRESGDWRLAGQISEIHYSRTVTPAIVGFFGLGAPGGSVLGQFNLGFASRPVTTDQTFRDAILAVFGSQTRFPDRPG